jgi:hypothetical protein
MASAWLQPCLVSPSYGTAEQAAEKASNRVILSGAKDLLFVYFQGENNRCFATLSMTYSLFPQPLYP